MKAESSPSTYTSQVDEAFFGSIGRLTISWAHLELGLDCMVEILYHGFGGNQIEAELPRNLQRKINFLRAAFKKMSIGTKATQGYLTFLDRVQTAAQTRHDIIHGIVVEQAENSGEATIVRIVRKQDGVKKRRFHVSTVKILKAAVEAQKLGGLILEGTNEIYTLIESLK